MVDNSSAKYEVVGKVRNGQEIAKYIVRGIHGEIIGLSKEEVIIHGSRGSILNIRIQTCNGKAIIRGKGIDLTTLPEMNVTSIKEKRKNLIKITRRIMLNGKIIGYEISDSTGNTRNLLRKDIFKLIKDGSIENAKITKWLNDKTGKTELIISGVNCNISKLPILIATSSGKIIDPKKSLSGLTTRALLINKVGLIENIKTHDKKSIAAGDFIVIGFNGDVSIENKDNILKNFKIVRGLNESTVDSYMKSIENLSLSLAGNNKIRLNTEMVKKWTIIEYR